MYVIWRIHIVQLCCAVPVGLWWALCSRDICYFCSHVISCFCRQDASRVCGQDICCFSSHDICGLPRHGNGKNCDTRGVPALRLSWETKDVLAADTRHVLSADTPSGLAADTVPCSCRYDTVVVMAHCNSGLVVARL